jgi:hypothetical protein
MVTSSTSIPSTGAILSPLAPSPLALSTWEEGREGGGEEELLGGNLEGLEDLDLILNDAVMSDIL